MVAYILSNKTLAINDLLQFEQYSFVMNIDCAGKSTIVVNRKPIVENDDYIVCREGNDTKFIGICESYTTQNNSGYTITMKEADSLFDRQIFVGNESLIISTGLEDFIRSEIVANWISSGDAALDKTWLTVNCLTHTMVAAKASTIGSVENGVYNLKTFIGNCAERYGITLEFVFSTTNGNALIINIRRNVAAAFPIDVEMSDIANFVEEYSVDALAKLNVKWFDTINETTTDYHYYLKTDRTITTNASDPNRADGTIKSMYVEAESYAQMYESVSQEFANNAYQHKIALSLKKDSRAYPASEYYVGRKVNIKTKTGIKETLVTGTSEGNGSSFVQLVFGKLKVTLIEKLRSR